MSQPGAGQLLGLAGTAMGVPGLGALGNMLGTGPSSAPAPAPTAAQAPVIVNSPAPSSGMSTGMMVAIGGGIIAFVGLILFLTLKKGK